jgi:uroporphyrinogen III methyltransferase/synthase
MTQDQIHELLIERARAWATVVRLKGGDPLLFGRGAEEAARLAAAGIRFEVVPGVTAGIGVTSYAGIPVTLRGVASAVAFITGHDLPDRALKRSGLDWSKLAEFPGTLVVYMGVTYLEPICRSLMEHGKPGETPAAVIESGTLPAQRTFTGTLETMPGIAAEGRIQPPALLVIGAVVRERESIAWFEKLPLAGQRIIITRPRDEAERVVGELEAMGADVLIAPAVEVAPIEDPRELDMAIDRLATYDWLVFTSVHGVRYFVERLETRGLDLRALGHLRLAAIGPTTARALGALHLKADVVPESFRSEALAEALGELTRGKRVLLARADRGRTVLKDELEKLADVDQVAVYHNRDAASIDGEIIARIDRGEVDWITMTSSAIARRFHELMPTETRAKIGRDARLASLSPVTTGTLRGLGWAVAAEADPYHWDGLVNAIVAVVEREARDGLK